MFVQQCAESLARMEGVGEICIVDCDSTYQPLLDWYSRQSDFRVLREANLKNHAPWRTKEDLSKGEPFYFVSDGDLDFGDCPSDMLLVLRDDMEKYPEIIKAGPSLKIDDLPNTKMNRDVRSHEGKYWTKEWDAMWYEAHIDTTAALYHRGHGWRGYGPALRCKPPYEARHLPWYITELPDDMRHYVSRLDPNGLTWSPRFGVQS